MPSKNGWQAEILSQAITIRKKMVMGKYRIVIEGEGLVNNSGPDDADVMAKKLVESLKIKNHRISVGRFENLEKKVEDINV